MADWQISAAAEPHMKRVQQLGAELALQPEEVLPYGHYVGKLDYARILERLAARPDGKYVNVTAITPTPLGEGKTTTTMGLVEGLAAIGKRVIGAIRQPSGGPTFNIKGSAAGAAWRNASRSPTSAWASPATSTPSPTPITWPWWHSPAASSTRPTTATRPWRGGSCAA